MELHLEDKLALVTGSTAGIGFAIAKALAAEGARVIVNGRNEKRVAGAVAGIRTAVPAARLEALPLDLAKAEGATETASRFPEIDILVNNLGVYEPKPLEEITDADWLAIIETNFLSGVRLSRHYLPRMRARNSGRIIFISSESAVNIPVEMIHYGVTKTMQVALARGLAETTAGTNVTVNTVLGGPTRSEEVDEFLADMFRTKQILTVQVEQAFFQSGRPSSLLR
jgi:NAD(P)-dependent dehydrogenase (short-subunit alcohol dehydrogenase family)